MTWIRNAFTYEISLLSVNTVETVCLLSNLRKKPDDVIHVTLDMKDFHRIVGDGEKL